MNTEGLIFIPDISGFSRFVGEMEIGHSRMIIQELLEILIDANDTGLQLSEIEGDAILFYKFGQRPSPQEIYAQVERMFSAFHQGLKNYDNQKYCQCEACLSAVNLTLKVITHYGEFMEYNVKNFVKLIGKDVIIAHQLLKNEIHPHEYWLITSGLCDDHILPGISKKTLWQEGEQTTPEGNAISYRYTQLGYLKEELPVELQTKPDLAGLKKLFAVSREYEIGWIPLFRSCGDYNRRPEWLEGVESVELDHHFLPRVGMRSRVVYRDHETSSRSYHYCFGEDWLEFSEIDERTGDLTYFTIEDLAGGRSRLRIDYYTRNTTWTNLLAALGFKKKVKAAMSRSLDKLAQYIEQAKTDEMLNYPY